MTEPNWPRLVWLRNWVQAQQKARETMGENWPTVAGEIRWDQWTWWRHVVDHGNVCGTHACIAGNAVWRWSTESWANEMGGLGDVSTLIRREALRVLNLDGGGFGLFDVGRTADAIADVIESLAAGWGVDLVNVEPDNTTVDRTAAAGKEAD